MHCITRLRSSSADVYKRQVHYFVMCLIMGAVFFALGFLDKSILGKTQASSLITFFVTILIFSNLAQTTPEQVLSVLPALLTAAACGVFGTDVYKRQASRRCDRQVSREIRPDNLQKH